MFVDMQVAVAEDLQINVSVARNLLEHVVEEAQSRVNVAASLAIEVHADADFRLCRIALHRGDALTSINHFLHLLPVGEKILAAKVLRQLSVAIAVADHKAVRKVVVSRQILAQHAGARFARGETFRGEAAVDVDGVELHALALQDVEHQVLRGPEVGFGIRGSSQSVLIAHHHKQIVSVLAQETECRDATGQEVELLEAVDLLVLRFAENGAVAVDEKYLLHLLILSQSFQ